jgi:hypothetical protein
MGSLGFVLVALTGHVHDGRFAAAAAASAVVVGMAAWAPRFRPPHAARAVHGAEPASSAAIGAPARA